MTTRFFAADSDRLSKASGSLRLSAKHPTAKRLFNAFLLSLKFIFGEESFTQNKGEE